MGKEHWNRQDKTIQQDTELEWQKPPIRHRNNQHCKYHWWSPYLTKHNMNQGYMQWGLSYQN